MTPTKFRHAGLDWIPHTPGDPMPCHGDTLVRVLMRYEQEEGSCQGGESPTAANGWDWGALRGGSIIGWHPIEDRLSNIKQCANCRWSMALDHRYDQVRCCNPDSDDAHGDVEATGFCHLFEDISFSPTTFKHADPAEKTIQQLCQDWAEDHSYAQRLALSLGVSKTEVFGDNYGVPGILCLLEMIQARVAQPMATHRRAAEWHGLSDAGLRLRLGEMTAQETRTVRAVLNAIMDETTND